MKVSQVSTTYYAPSTTTRRDVIGRAAYLEIFLPGCEIVLPIVRLFIVNVFDRIRRQYWKAVKRYNLELGDMQRYVLQRI